MALPERAQPAPRPATPPGGSPQAAFARFVRRAIDDAKNERGWTVTDLAARTGVGRSTVFRWLAGDWQDYPELAKVRGFCTALEVPVSAAFRALGLPDGETAPNRVRSEPPLEADVEVILGRLADPTVPAEEKKLIRDMLRYLAQRPVRRVG
ncbi:helix-turn-helix domain-containing protein [Polymorphospora rubra]|uniref:helix-turn-helix domain-containing protein n=1 Tax=Polymorphospora rubra TaxID=338584 RepID=UPI0033EDC767